MTQHSNGAICPMCFTSYNMAFQMMKKR